jgi:hypothetical protein
MRKRLLAAALIFAGAHSLALAQAVPRGTEFQVNSYTPGAQYCPAVTTDPSGRFVVVWRGDSPGGSYRILARRFNGKGNALDAAEIRVNDSHAFTWPPFGSASVASNDAGEFVVVWTASYDGSYTGILGRRFDRAGAPLGGEFQVNAYTMGFQLSPTVAMDPAGNFVVAWSGLDGDGPGIFGRCFDTGVSPLAGDFRINDVTAGDQRFPAVAMDPNGGFVAVWDSVDKNTPATMGRRFDLSGDPLDVSDFQVNAYTISRPFVYRAPAVAMDPNGGFAVVWESDDQGGDGTGIFGRRFDSLAKPLDVDFQVNSYTTGSESFPDVAMDRNGKIAIVWQSLDLDGSLLGVFGRRYDSAGVSLDASEFRINTYTTESQSTPAIAFEHAGTFAVVWTSKEQDGDSSGVFGQRFCDGDGDGDGLCDAHDIVITAPVEGATLDCTSPATTRPRITWQKGNYDRFRAMISWDPAFAQGGKVTSGKELIRRAAWTPGRKQWRNACNNAGPDLYVRIFGVDRNVGKKNANRKTRSQTVKVDVLK